MLGHGCGACGRPFWPPDASSASNAGHSSEPPIPALAPGRAPARPGTKMRLSPPAGRLSRPPHPLPRPPCANARTMHSTAVRPRAFANRTTVRPFSVARTLSVSVRAEKVLIVNTKGGGHAFIGLHLAKQLTSKGHSVTILNDGDEVSRWRRAGRQRAAPRAVKPGPCAGPGGAGRGRALQPGAWAPACRTCCGVPCSALAPRLSNRRARRRANRPVAQSPPLPRSPSTAPAPTPPPSTGQELQEGALQPVRQPARPQGGLRRPGRPVHLPHPRL
jgi:hypothetical protein